MPRRVNLYDEPDLILDRSPDPAGRDRRRGVVQNPVAVDRGAPITGNTTVGGRRPRTLDGVDIVYLRIREPFNTKIRRKIYRALKETPDGQLVGPTLAVPVDGPEGESNVVEVSLEKPVNETLAGIETLEMGDGMIEIRDGTAIVRGTRTEAHRIAALVEGGMSIDEILLDYPGCTAEQVHAAVSFAKAHPKQGRPFPARTVTSVFRQGRGGLALAFAAARDEE